MTFRRPAVLALVAALALLPRAASAQNAVDIPGGSSLVPATQETDAWMTSPGLPGPSSFLSGLARLGARLEAGAWRTGVAWHRPALAAPRRPVPSSWAGPRPSVAPLVAVRARR